MNDARPLGSRLLEIAGLCLRLGVTDFGGPAGHVALLEVEVVHRRHWMGHEQFHDLLGFCRLLPGPTSTQTAISCGRVRGGILGLCIAGLCFVLPAALLATGFAWLYVRYSSLPEIAPVLYGVKPAVLAIIIAAITRLAHQSLRTWQLAIVGLAVLVSAELGLNPILGILAGAALGVIWLRLSPAAWKAVTTGALVAALTSTKSALAAGTAATAVKGVSLGKLALFFAKITLVLFGGGYVLLAFLHLGLVAERGWLTQQQLLDAIAVAQFLPGPVFVGVTFLGYVLAGGAGAVIASLGVFFPSFIMVPVLSPLAPRLRRSPWTRPFLDAVNISAVGLMAGVTVTLGITSMVHWPAWVILALASVATVRYKVNSAWIVLGGAALGLLFAPWTH
jgi:chromate transporter